MTKQELSQKLKAYPGIMGKVAELNRQVSGIINMQKQYDDALPKAQVINGLPHGSGLSDPTPCALLAVENVLNRYSSDITEISREIICLLDEKERIDRALRMLTPNERQIIELRFFKGETWEWIGERVHYCRQSASVTCKKTLDKLLQIMKSVNTL